MRKALMLFAAALFVAGSSQAAMIQEGTNELGVEGLIDFEAEADTLVDLTLSYGYFIADQVEVGGAIGIVNDDVFTQWTIGAFAEYNIDLGNEWVPFFGVSAELGGADIDGAIVDEDNTAFIFGIDAGIKYFIVEHLAITGAVDFDVATDDIYRGDKKAEDTDVALEFGLRCYF